MHAIINIAINAARNASKIVIRSIDDLESSRVNTKNRFSYAEEIEQAAKQEIVNTIHKAYPEHKILDNTVETESYSTEDYVWVIDAIDGIINYSHGFPHFSISVALKHKNKIQHGVIYDPIRQDLFTASRGDGAYLNEHRMRISAHKTMEGALLGTGFPHKQIQHLKPFIITFRELFPLIDGIRRSGSSALDLAYVAAGRLEGFWEFSLKEWNMAAGVLLVQEAGGLVTDFQGEDKYLENGNIIAGNPKIFKAISQAIQISLKE